MKIICISGHAQHGKDTFAKMLEEELELRNQKVLVTHYADLVKYICKQFFGWDGQKDEAGRHLLPVCWNRHCKKTERKLLGGFHHRYAEVLRWSLGLRFNSRHKISE